jgi:hypothetical protein
VRLTPTNFSQSDTHHNNIYKEQGKDLFYSEFVFQSIIKIVGTLLGMAGGGMAIRKVLGNSGFYMCDNTKNNDTFINHRSSFFTYPVLFFSF